MQLLLDTHVVYWWLAEKQLLSPKSQAAISAPDADVFVSVASAWEMAIKVGAGQWHQASAFVDDFEQHMLTEAFRILPIDIPHVRAAGLMTAAHRDPFDRLLAAQATLEGLTLVTADAKVQSLGAAWLWRASRSLRALCPTATVRVSSAILADPNPRSRPCS